MKSIGQRVTIALLLLASCTAGRAEPPKEASAAGQDKRPSAGTKAAAPASVRSAPSPPRPAASPAPTRVAVCDIVHVFDNYQRAKDLTHDIKARAKAVHKEDHKRGEAIRDLEAKLKALTPNSKEHRKLLNQIQDAKLQRKNRLALLRDRAMREHCRLTLEMYKEILSMIERVAKDKGYVLVLHYNPKPPTAKTTPEVLRAIASRRVVFADPRADITHLVLERMNAEYRERKKDGQPPGKKPKPGAKDTDEL